MPKMQNGILRLYVPANLRSASGLGHSKKMESLSCNELNPMSNLTGGLLRDLHKHFQRSLCCRQFERIDAAIERNAMIDQTSNVELSLREQSQCRRELAAAAADDRDFVDDDARPVE